jgi:hypothetical protein
VMIVTGQSPELIERRRLIREEFHDSKAVTIGPAQHRRKRP